MATGREMMCEPIGAPMWVLTAVGAWPKSTGACPTTAGAVRIGAGKGAWRMGAGARSGPWASGAGKASGAGARAGAIKPHWAPATTAKMLRAT